MRARHLNICFVVILAMLLAACGAQPSAVEQDDVDIEESYTEENAAEPTLMPEPTSAPEPTAAPTLQEGATKDMYTVGDTARVDALLIRVDGVKATEESELGAPNEGNEFLLVELTLENSSDESVDVAPLLHMFAEDEAGQKYGLDVSASMDFMSVNGSIQAGETAQATVGYQVPKDAAGLKWVFITTTPDATAGLKETGRAVFDVAQ